MPRYNELAPAFFANGVDRIVCMSVNDAFVMNEWARTQECGNVLMVPDGNGEFTEKMGMLVDKTELGFGKRSWRYSMLVKDGVIEKMFIEPEKPGDPFEVSDADTMLNHINPKAKKPDQVAILTREGCGYCAKAKALLKELGYAFSEVRLDHSDRSRVVGAITGRGTVPQVFVNGQHIGASKISSAGRRKQPDCSALSSSATSFSSESAKTSTFLFHRSPGKARSAPAWAHYLGDDPARLTAALHRSFSLERRGVQLRRHRRDARRHTANARRRRSASSLSSTPRPEEKSGAALAPK